MKWMELIENQYGGTDDKRRSQAYKLENWNISNVVQYPIGYAAIVKSQDTSKVYYVIVTPYDSACTCPDNTHRDVACKHILALAMRLDSQGQTINQDRVRVTFVPPKGNTAYVARMGNLIDGLNERNIDVMDISTLTLGSPAKPKKKVVQVELEL